MTPLPVTVVSGYLGAGKTTLVNHLLSEAHGRRLTVLVNDFGEIALDESLIVNREGDTIALSNGCMCCSIGGDLFDALDRILRAEPRAEHLIIETSGVADPAKVAQIALAEPEMRLALVATLADAANFEAGLADPLLSDTLARQARAAGLVLITKGDLAGEAGVARVAAHLERLAPGASQVEAPQGRAPLELLLDDRETPLPREGHDHDHRAFYRSWAWSGEGALDRAGLEAFLDAGAPGLYRLKGVVRLAGGGWAEVHRAGRQSSLREVEAPAAQGRAVAIGLAERFDPAVMDRMWEALIR